MSTLAGRAAALPRHVVGYDSDVEATGAGRQHTRAPRIHPALYAFAVISAAILFILSAAALEGYRPNAHFPGRHDELLVSPSGDHAGLGRCQQDKSAALCHSVKEPKHVSASWNNIASVLGGFSTTYVTSPQLNTSWVARPGGLGVRVEGQGLVGKMEYMKASRDEGEDPSIDRTGCRPDAALAPPKEGVPRIALIQRGECQFLTKLLNAQLQDFDAAIVYNDYEHSRRQSPPRDDHGFDGHRDEDELISMWSPAREAALLRIPSVFVSNRTGKILETLIAVENDSGNDAIVIIEPEDTPHFLLMDIIIALFFLPTIFTTVVLIVTRLRQIRYRAQQRAPQTLVDSLPCFQWREGLDLNIDALATGEKDNSSTAADNDVTRPKSAGMDHRLAAFLSRALRRPAAPGNGVSARHTVIPARKARHVAKKIFQQKECAICLSDFVTGDTVRLLPCGHLFHKEEIDSWLTEQKRWCPVCRFPVDGSDEEAVDEPTHDNITRTSSSPSPPSPLSTPQPIIMPEDVSDSAFEEVHPVASSSTASERTPLLQTLSRSSDKS